MTAPRTAQPVDVAVVGAGISGLTAAFHLHRAGRRVVVLEATGHPGGAIVSHRLEGPGGRDDDFLFELGPNTVLESRPAVPELIAAAGLGDQRLTANAAARKRYLWKGGALELLPGGPLGLVRTSLFSARAKVRLLREPFVAPADPEAGETIADFVRRRLGKEFLDHAVGPFVSGVYAGDPERLSVRWATRKIWQLEQQHGSLIRGAFARRKGPAPGGAMISFNDGLDTLPRRLAQRVGGVRTGTPVTGLRREEMERPVDPGLWHLAIPDGEIPARQVVLATPADVTAELLAEVSDGASRELADIPYAAVAVVNLGVRRDQVAHPLDGFGFLAPRVEDLRPLGCLFPSTLFPDRAPADHAVLTVFLGGRTDPEVVEMEDGELLALVGRELERSLGLAGPAVVSVVRRWPRAIPQYEVPRPGEGDEPPYPGHGHHVQLAERLEEDLPGLHLVGNWRGGVSVPDCIQNATERAVAMAGPPC